MTNKMKLRKYVTLAALVGITSCVDAVPYENTAEVKAVNPLEQPGDLGRQFSPTKTCQQNYNLAAFPYNFVEQQTFVGYFIIGEKSSSLVNLAVNDLAQYFEQHYITIPSAGVLLDIEETQYAPKNRILIGSLLTNQSLYKFLKNYNCIMDTSQEGGYVFGLQENGGVTLAIIGSNDDYVRKMTKEFLKELNTLKRIKKQECYELKMDNLETKCVR